MNGCAYTAEVLTHFQKLTALNVVRRVIGSLANYPAPNTASSRLFEGWGELPAVANQSESDLPA